MAAAVIPQLTESLSEAPPPPLRPFTAAFFPAVCQSWFLPNPAGILTQLVLGAVLAQSPEHSQIRVF